ncbi:MAG TPA: ATP-binding cassette domain-containing protein, partial [Gemmatimonadaceae bacterium]|nr:ATP-binding cassette domain-containing protein [Gemmatimonadaceae bacterium]
MTAAGVGVREEPMLSMHGISKAFGGIEALVDVSLIVRRGTVHALVGENGAGKTTLMRIVLRMIAPDRGTITLAGAARPIRTTADAIASGIGMVHQHFTNVPAMTVAENVALGARGRYNKAGAAELVRRVGAASGLPLDPDARVSELPVGAQQRLEIVKALARDVRMLILDEPTAVLAPSEAGELLRWIRGFANAGNAVVLITHKLREALAVADDVTVLRRGSVVLAANAASLDADSLAAALVGDDRQTIEARPRRTPAHSCVAKLVAVNAEDARGARTLRSVDLEVRAGEIVGVAGVEGSGQRELLRAL